MSATATIYPRARTATAATLAVLLLGQSLGCTAWLPVDSGATPLSTGTNRKVLIRKYGGWRLEADSARAVGDSLLVFRGGGVDTIPLTEVNEVEVRRVDWWKTTLVVGGTIGALFIIGLLGCADGGCD